MNILKNLSRLTCPSRLGISLDRFYSNKLPYQNQKIIHKMSIEEILQPFRDHVKVQGDVVRKLKESNASPAEIKHAVAELKLRKKALDDKVQEFETKESPFDRVKFEDTLKQRFFYDQSFSIYGGVTGLYDFGPMGCAIKSNILQIWRNHFIVAEQLLEVDCSVLTPESVLKTSGHLERFTDYMVKDMKTGECFRADHLVESALQNKIKAKGTSEEEKKILEDTLIKLDNFKAEELDELIKKYNLKSPINNNDLSECQLFNLMFGTLIGPTGLYKAFLRPETAQGIFVNFPRLLQFNQGKLPFGVAQIGLAFRNEISPRSGLLRVREFTMAEIEFFIDPKEASKMPKFSTVENYKFKIYSACDQMDGKLPREVTVKEAVDEGIICNQTLGYFMVRIHQFLLKIGIDKNRLRFRQHLANEMAHYARDCWDAECQTSFGWVECVGCADRSCYDLTQHAKSTGTRMVAEKPLAEPYTRTVCQVQPDKAAIGKCYKAEAKSIIETLKNYETDEAEKLKKVLEDQGETNLTVNDKSFIIKHEMVKFSNFDQKVQVEEITPNVIEPSFGIGRILYSVLEHNFKVREDDEQRTYLTLPTAICPYKCSILPLSSKEEFTPFVNKISNALTELNVPHKIDETSGSIGRRYARTDQIAVPFGITIDFDTVNVSPSSVTLRERDTMKQIRVNIDELAKLVHDLSEGRVSWSEASKLHPEFKQQETA